ncbi:MAG: hypothetical protein KC466_01380 [Myxococcales bacterium]|nr:hypothetical protein [Myxococcales bacterium]
MVLDDFPVHLCQPRPGLACGACCGLYNHADSRAETLRPRLRERTRLAAEMRGEDDWPERYAEIIKGREPTGRLYETIYTCEYLGYVDDGERRVGCLLHPLLNDGKDLRDHSFYGREICAGHFCPSYTYLTEAEQRAVVAACDDWYLYGAVVTDIDLVKDVFAQAERALAESIRADVVERPGPARALGDLFRLRFAWPWRAEGMPRFGKYYFLGEDYGIAEVNYAEVGAAPSRFDRILRAFESRFETIDALREAESRVEGHLDAFVGAYDRARADVREESRARVEIQIEARRPGGGEKNEERAEKGGVCSALSGRSGPNEPKRQGMRTWTRE